MLVKNLNMCYGLEGIDSLLFSILRDVEKGFYIDVGANHPEVISNTYAFYLKGWSGICIDGNTQLADQWKSLRPRDCFLATILSDEIKSVEYTIYPDTTISTINEESKLRYNQRFKESDIIMQRVKTDTLQKIIDNFGVINEIHLLSVDIEGEELNALRGLDFEKNAPGVVVVEIKNLSLYNLKENDVFNFLMSKGYVMICKLLLDAVFVKPDKPYLNWIPKSLLAV
jgi:FkbM family methyltransferase